MGCGRYFEELDNIKRSASARRSNPLPQPLPFRHRDSSDPHFERDRPGPRGRTSLFERHRTTILFGFYTLISVCLLAWSADRVVQLLKHTFYYLWLPAGPAVAQMGPMGSVRPAARLAPAAPTSARAEFESRWLDGRLDTVRQKMLEEETSA